MLQALIALLMAGSLSAAAAAEYTGLSLSTPYPDRSVQAGQTAVIPLTVRSFKLEPQEVKLRAISVPRGWAADIQGDARTVGAVFLAPDESREVTLHITPGKDITGGTHRFEFVAEGASHKALLPITLNVVKTLPDWLALTSSMPTLKGSASTQFSYDVKIANRSGRDATVSLSAEAPQGFEVSFTPQYGSENVTAVLVKAGETKDMSVKVTPPRNAEARDYRLTVRAAAGDSRAAVPLAMTVTGKPELALTTPSGQLSGEARIGKPATVSLVLQNNGSAPAQDVNLSAQTPSNWKVTFNPPRVDAIPPRQTVNVTADILPADQSLAGDYMVTFDAASGADRASANYRVTVLVSTLWGIVGIAIAAAAILVVGFAVVRFGRR